MIRLRELTGRAVVDMSLAEKVGEIDDVILDPDSCRVAGFVVGRGSSLLGGGQKLVFDAARVHSVGPDAVTVDGANLEHAEGAYPGLPRRRDVIGRKIVGHSGKMYGHIHDVLVDATNGRILGYALEDAAPGGLDGIFGNPRVKELEYLRADADLRVGPQLVMVPDDAIVQGADRFDVASNDMPAAAGGWAHADQHQATSTWLANPGTTATGHAAPHSTEAPTPASPAPAPIYSPPVATPPAPQPAPVTPEPFPTAPLTPEPAYEELKFGAPPASPEPFGEVR